jgi:hypothetical protein
VLKVLAAVWPVALVLDEIDVITERGLVGRTHREHLDARASRFTVSPEIA